MTATQEILDNRLRQSTGAVLTDSGFAFGRHWQRNKRISDFRDLPVSHTEFEVYNNRLSLSVSYHNIFHYLSTYTSVETELTEAIEVADNLITEVLERELHYLEILDTFLSGELRNLAFEAFYSQDKSEQTPEILEKISLLPCSDTEEGYYDPTKLVCHPMDSSGYPYIDSTYNDPDRYFLSQDIQFGHFDWTDNRDVSESGYLIISLHQGADARWGYGMPFVVKLDEISQFGRGSWELTAEGGDGSSAYYEYSGVRGYLDYARYTDAEGNEFEDNILDPLNCEISTNPADKGKGKVYFDEENNQAYCPNTGGVLTFLMR